eukprot:CAMPEP_0198151686 /NCGR_PEP_ID=MMETSP1443-20131203/56617_1 /TAXON_ID=186043 /ORGANISM="Entomoneis sp., Strain CCMP2396" /LENGTH=435 /DNA_ID=CAMNT_0043817441 /DNA_START=119 /DNA_END=1422 /DNA_ORIENTATION=-
MVVSTVAPVVARTLFSRIKTIPMEYPFAFGVVFSGFKTSFSDLMVQKVVEQREQVDWKRNAAFAAFGFFYLGGVQYAIYVPFFSRIFPTAKTFSAQPWRQKIKDFRGMFECGAQVFIDQCIHHPLMYFPAFYITKELVMREKPDIMACLREYQGNMNEDLQALWKIWVPATLFNFAFMPMWARIPVAATTSLVWTMILSTMRGGDVAHRDDLAGGAVTGATLHMVEAGFGTLFIEPVELDADKAHVMITAAGVDQPGLVAEFTRAVANAEGSITHSRMVRLGNDFIITLHAAVPPEKYKTFISKLRKQKEIKSLNLQFQMLQHRDMSKMIPPQLGIRLRAVGEDKPGMLASISETLVSKGLSIETVSTNLQLHSRKGDGRPRHDFVIEADCVATRPLDQEHLESLVEDLNHLKQELQLDSVDVRVQRRAPQRQTT